jgi:hypothetical protein
MRREEFIELLGEEAGRASAELARTAPRLTEEQRHALAILLKRSPREDAAPCHDTGSAA